MSDNELDTFANYLHVINALKDSIVMPSMMAVKRRHQTIISSRNHD
jgi:hypothetical protein